MLVLSRKLGEKIRIDGDIEVEVLEISGNRIRLGITAPQDCRIVRSECSFETGTSGAPTSPRLNPGLNRLTCFGT